MSLTWVFIFAAFILGNLSGFALGFIYVIMFKSEREYESVKRRLDLENSGCYSASKEAHNCRCNDGI